MLNENVPSSHDALSSEHSLYLTTYVPAGTVASPIVIAVRSSLNTPLPLLTVKPSESDTLMPDDGPTAPENVTETVGGDSVTVAPVRGTDETKCVVSTGAAEPSREPDGCASVDSSVTGSFASSRTCDVPASLMKKNTT